MISWKRVDSRPNYRGNATVSISRTVMLSNACQPDARVLLFQMHTKRSKNCTLDLEAFRDFATSIIRDTRDKRADFPLATETGTFREERRGNSGHPVYFQWKPEIALTGFPLTHRWNNFVATALFRNARRRKNVNPNWRVFTKTPWNEFHFA